MSYNVLQQPALFQPAYNDMMFVVSSTNNTQPNFNYLADVYVGTEVFRLRSPANPTYGSGIFNVGRIIESYVNSDIVKGTYGFQLNANSYKSYYIKFGEEYGVSSGVTQYPNLSTTPTKYVWNAVLDMIDFQDYLQTRYLIDGVGNSLNTDLERDIEIQQNAWEYYVVDDVTAVKYAKVSTFNSAGILEQTFAFLNPYQTSGTIGHHFGRFACGTKDLDNAPSPAAGMLPVTSGTTAYYTVSFSDTTDQSGAYDSERHRYNIVESDCKYIAYRVHFLNELGAFESFNFTKSTRKDIDISRSKYKAPYGSLTSASAFGYNKTDRLERNYFTSMKEGLKLKSDWITEEEHLWLQELITSPEIFIDDPTYGFVAVNCTVSKIDVKTSLNDKLFNLEIDLDFTFNRYRQRL